MQDPDLLSAHRVGAGLSLAGLAVLMLGEAGEPRPLATAAGCLVAALAAFAVDALRRRSGRRARPAAGRRTRRAAAHAAAPFAPEAVTAGRWAMPAAQRDPRVHAALSMSVERFRAGAPRAADDRPEAGSSPEPDLGPNVVPSPGPNVVPNREPGPATAVAQDTARRAALADVRNRRLARRD